MTTNDTFTVVHTGRQTSEHNGVRFEDVRAHLVEAHKRSLETLAGCRVTRERDGRVLPYRFFGFGS